MLKQTAFLSPSAFPLLKSSSRRLCRRFIAAQINAPDGLPNARDLASTAPSILREDRLYRGATPASLPQNPNHDAVEFLRSTVCLVDLRSRDERISDVRSQMQTTCGPDFEDKENHIGLLNKRRVVWGLTRVLPPSQLQQLAANVISNPLRMRSGIVNQMDQGGLILLNRIIVEAGASSVGRAMNTVVDGLQKGRVYFYCSAGKDRTGLLAALILKVLGVGDREVIFDYVKSAEMWENGPYHIRLEYSGRLERAGLTPLNWIGCPPEVMQDTLLYIRKQYGSIEDYLIRCGFNEQKMEQLRDVMLLR